ncbi:hypothetical protein DM02DRAFT_431823 [Periconia macrospinosa]|uniref:C2H2-type domain-containing protein n=1 Tax=Periconia macrospinosa TaxID=97972 RepID=A0A2V1DN22_9PLEO|nr:hypothetical protein DM02DRAFT_431823 [Periconia macrospinosa]
MTMYHQYGDLPQIPSFSEDAPCGQWNDQTVSGQARFRVEEDFHYHGADGSTYPTMGTVERFLADQSLISQSLLHPVTAQMVHNQSQNYQQFNYWPSQQLRYLSPDDSTSVSGSSSYATPNEVHSPHHVHTYGNPDDFAQNSLPYPNGEYSTQSSTLDLPMPGGSINPRDIEYEHEPDAELIVEEPEVIETKILSPFSPDTTLAGTDNSEDTQAEISLRDAEEVQPMTKEEELSSDTEYMPSRSARRRRSSTSNGGTKKQGQRRYSHQNKKSTSPKASPGKVGKRSNRTIASVHTGKAYADSQSSGDTQRHFPCPLSTYGCKSDFSSKNEWKRHVSTQHIKLGFWRCDLCTPTVDSNDDQTLYHNDFNRKDLFTQHLRRMHAASTPSNRNQKEHLVVTENNIAEHQKRCFMVLRETPPRSKCLFCPETFCGPASWDLRMEHIGRHLEKDRKTGGLHHTDTDSWIPDKDLEQWLYKEGIITFDRLGQFMIGDGQPK